MALWYTNWITQLTHSMIRTSGALWESLHTYPDEESSQPRVAIDANRQAVAVWSTFHRDSNSTFIESSALPFGGSWNDPPVVISCPGTVFTRAENPPTCATGHLKVLPLITAGEPNQYIVVWVNLSTHNLESRRYNSSTGWDSDILIVSEHVASFHPSVAIGSDGTAYVVWERLSDHVILVSSLELDSDVWSQPIRLSGEGAAVRPQIKADHLGNLLAVWTLDHGTQSVQAASLRLESDDWSAPTSLSSVGQDAQGPEFAFDADGNAIVCWLESNRIYAAVLYNHGLVSEVSVLSIGEAGVTSFPSIAAGYAVVAWTEDRTEDTSVVKAVVTDLSAPQGLVGHKILNCLQQEWCNRIRWIPSTNPALAGYCVYRNGQLIARLSSAKHPMMITTAEKTSQIPIR